MDFLVLLEANDDIGKGRDVSDWFLASGTDFLKAQGYSIPEKNPSMSVESLSLKYILFGKGVSYCYGDQEYADEDTKLVVIIMTDGTDRQVV
ncbi:hypothetical protein GGH94_005264 [Coemansia aciculifera]|uniref:Uncharacterized protein n=1 Tax=Coemansia aciculifera TaxID=417176 RepID=A0A9W8M1G5_9FUNG|nr:hypothetical protein GGH94_005264 [Coemansia aciculifera]